MGPMYIVTLWIYIYIYIYTQIEREKILPKYIHTRVETIIIYQELHSLK